MTDALIEPAADIFVTEAYKVLVYCFGHESYVNSLQDKCDELKALGGQVDVLAKQADRKGCIISPTVDLFKEKKPKMLKEAEDVIREANRLPTSCCAVLCESSNWRSCYRIAKLADRLSKDIDELVADGHEITERTVAYDPNYRPVQERLAESYNSIASRNIYLEKLTGVLVGDRDQKHAIGIYGETGAGKTTLVNKLAVDIEKLFKDEFKGVVLMSWKKLQKEGVDYAQDIVAESIGFDLSNYKINDIRARKISDILAKLKPKVLIVIDDVDQEIDLKSIGIPLPSASCRIVLISRSLSVCEAMKTEMNLKVEPMNQQESLALFDKLAKQYSSTSTTTSTNLQEARKHVLSKQAWLPGEIKAGITTFHKEPLQTTKPIASLDQKQIASSSKQSTVGTSMIDATALSIKKEMIGVGALKFEHEVYWKVSSKVAELNKVLHYLDIQGTADRNRLTPATHYGAYFVYQLKPEAKGFKNTRVTLELNSSEKDGYLDPSSADDLHNQGLISDSHMPNKRAGTDGWFEVDMGEFYTNQDLPRDLNLRVMEHNDANAKSGLMVLGIELRPRDPK